MSCIDFVLNFKASSAATFAALILASGCAPQSSERSELVASDPMGRLDFSNWNVIEDAEMVLLGHEVSNGGNVVHCEKEYPALKGRKTYPLDFYYGEMLYGFPVSKTFNGAKITATNLPAMQRFKRLDSEFQAAFADEYRLFMEQTPIYFRSEPLLVNTQFFNIPLPGPDCRIEQIASFEIDEDGTIRTSIHYSTKLDELDLSGIWSHETLYRLGIKRFRNYSAMSVMLLNYFLHTERFELLTPEQFADMLGRRLGFIEHELIEGTDSDDELASEGPGVFLPKKGQDLIHFGTGHNTFIFNMEDGDDLLQWDENVKEALANNTLILQNVDRSRHKIVPLGSCLIVYDVDRSTLIGPPMREEVNRICFPPRFISTILVKEKQR